MRNRLPKAATWRSNGYTPCPHPLWRKTSGKPAPDSRYRIRAGPPWWNCDSAISTKCIALGLRQFRTRQREHTLVAPQVQPHQRAVALPFLLECARDEKLVD